MKSLNIIALVILLLFQFSSCKKSPNTTPDNRQVAIIKFSLAGVVNAELAKKSSISSLNGLKTLNSFETHDGFETSSSFSKTQFKNSKIRKYANIPQGTSYLNEGVKYRLLVYELNDENEEEFYAQVDLESKFDDADGEPLEVYEGTTYRWYAYSYNTSDAMAPVSNLDHPIIPMGNNKDFIFTQGEVEITDDFVSEAIIFERKTAQIILEIDARGLFTDEIRDLNLKFPANILKTGNYDLKNNQVIDVSSLPEQNILLSNFQNVDEGYNDRKQTYLYTVSSEIWDDISFSMSKLDILLDDNSSIRSFPATNINVGKEYDVEVGYRYLAKIDLIESALSFGGVSWARENLYMTTGTRNPYRFYHENKQTNDNRSYFSFRGHIPGKWGSTVIQEQRDPCALVHPANRWMTPSKSSFAELTKNSSGVVVDGLLPTVLGNLLFGLAGQQTLNATYGPNYIQYNSPSGVNSVYPASSNALRFYYNGYDLIDINALGDGWVNVNLGSTYGLATGLWTKDQGSNLLNLLGAGAWGYFGTTRSVVLSSPIATGINSPHLINLNVVGINFLSSPLQNIRCIRNPAWETLSQLPDYNPEPNLN